MKPILCCWAMPGHDAYVYVYHEGKTHYLPFSSIFGIKHYDLRYHGDKHTIKTVLEHIEKNFGIANDFGVFLLRGHAYVVCTEDEIINSLQLDPVVRSNNVKLHSLDGIINFNDINYEQIIAAEEQVFLHHEAHACCGFVQSPFDKAFVLTYDGAGDYEVSGLFSFDKNGYKRYQDSASVVERNIVAFYGQIGQLMPTVFKECKNFDLENPIEWVFALSQESLDHAGKVMGLSAYGKELGHLEQNIMDEARQMFSKRRMSMAISMTRPIGRIINPLIEKGNIPTSWDYLRFKGLLKSISQWKDEDIAYCAQKIFEREILSIVSYNLDRIKEHDNNLVLSGGGALNVLANEYIRETFPWINIYVPPNPGDEGLGLGFLAWHHLQQNKTWPKYKINDNVIGPELYDIDDFENYITDRSPKQIDIFQLTEMLKSGKILGLMQGRLESGPRALGFRSILCDPSYPKMKDDLNSKVKFREWFRPFAPVCLKEEAEKYFISNSFENLECMSFAPTVRKEHREKLPAITHVDNTARLQTVTEKDNDLLYFILKAFDGVLLNTSLNVQGKPICNTLKEGFEILDNTGLDNLIVMHENRLYCFE